jgi:hypothetical protein
MCSTTPGKSFNDACFGFKTSVLGEEFFHKPLCMPVVHVQEDTWSYITVSALHDISVDGPEPFILPPSEYPDPAGLVMMKLIIDVQWGMLDIFNEEANAMVSSDANCWFRCQGGDPKTAGQLCGGISDTTTCKGGGICSYKQCSTCCTETEADAAIRKQTNGIR